MDSLVNPTYAEEWDEFCRTTFRETDVSSNPFNAFFTYFLDTKRTQTFEAEFT